MIAVSAAILPVTLWYKLRFHDPVSEYAHLLVSYHFGFAKRALIGTVVSLFSSKVPVGYVYGIGVSAWLIALLLFLVAFKRIIGFREQNLPLFAFTAGSPFFFKNFLYSIGYFDIYGCIAALAALILPVGAFFLLILTAACVVLILIHPIHMLMYCPVIMLIAFVRYYCALDLAPSRVAYGLILVLVVLAVFVASVFFGQMPVAPETWLSHVQSRATVPIDPSVSYIWYSKISDEIARTWSTMGTSALRIPVYALLIALHFPVGRYLQSLIQSLVTPMHRLGILIGIAAICAGYLIIGAVVDDYSRWVSNWAVCMFLVMLAGRLLPSTIDCTEPPIAAEPRQSRALGWAVALIPRVGVSKPF